MIGIYIFFLACLIICVESTATTHTIYDSTNVYSIGKLEVFSDHSYAMAYVPKGDNK